jgi:hypothetical protein
MHILEKNIGKNHVLFLWVPGKKEQKLWYYYDTNSFRRTVFFGINKVYKPGFETIELVFGPIVIGLASWDRI